MKVTREPSRPSDLSPAKRALVEKRLRGAASTNHTASATTAPIPRRSRPGPAPLSFAQRRLWFAQQMAPASPLYNISQGLRLEGPLNLEALARALTAVVERHEPLRTRFLDQEGEPIQVIAPPRAMVPRSIDLSLNPHAHGTVFAAMEQIFEEEVRKPFDLAKDVLLRAVVVRLGREDHALLITVHHIVSDGWSMGILVREVLEFYLAASKGVPLSLPGLPISYGDFADWQRQSTQQEMLKSHGQWWAQQLAGAPECLEIPSDWPRPATQSFRGQCRWRTFPKGLSEALKALSQAEGATLFMTLLAAFQILLHRLSRQTDMLIGSPSAGRGRTETEGLVGLFVNMLVLRSRWSGETSFSDFLRSTRETLLEAYAHQDLPFERIVEQRQPQRSPSFSPLIQVVFALQRSGERLPAVPGLKVALIPEREADTGTAKFDLTWLMEDSDEGLRAVIEYSTDLFCEATIDRFLSEFQILLEGIVENPKQAVSRLPLLLSSERHRMLVEWNDTAADYPRDKSIGQLFAEQVVLRPDAIAVTGEQSLTYRELDARAGSLARRLRGLGVGPNVVVAVALERSVELIVALVAVSKAGGAYLALDSAQPASRLAFILKDADARVLIARKTRLHLLRTSMPEPSPQVVLIEDELSQDAGSPESEAGPANFPPAKATDRAFVIYTSGTSGAPKGVCIPHRAVNRSLFNTNYAEFGPSQVVAQVSNPAFDASTFEIWGALLHGGRLAILPTDVVLSPPALARAIQEQRITTMFVTTALFNQLARERPEIFQLLRQLLFGGEVANVACVRSVLQAGPPGRLLHMYGPTEATTFATWQEVRTVEENAVSLPIGRPIANTELYVLDDDREPVPVGVVGELYIGGDGLAEGYLNQAELTAAKFLFHSWPDGKTTRLYRTGDLVRYLPDGSLSFVGRKDSQVKVRGFRIELAEVEAALHQHPGVEACAIVLSKDAEGEGRLIAYVVGSAGGGVHDDLREFLHAKLPDYMVPSAFVFLPSLPLNANGKVDRKHLPPPEPSAHPAPKRPEALHDAIEVALARLWEELLNVPAVGARDNFFELGGHSLLVLRLLARIEKIFGKALPVAAVFQAPTVEQLARLIREQERAQDSRTGSIVPIQPSGSKPPLMLVHGAGGGMFWGYANLAEHLGPDQPVYGFKTAEASESAGATTIEAIAADFVAQLRTFQPVGPYFLGGYCFGGNVAYEMARQLVSQGLEVALLVLMNSTPTETRSQGDALGWRRFARRSGSVAYQVVSFLRRPWVEQARILRWRMRSLKQRVAQSRQLPVSEWNVDQLVDLSAYSPEQRRVWEVHIRALIAHHTQPYAGKVTLLRSRGYHSEGSLDSTYGWREYAAETAVRIVPGAHEQILEKPFVKGLAKELKECLSAAQDAVAVGGKRAASSQEVGPAQVSAGVLSQWNDTRVEYPREKCVHQLFEEQAARTPTATALIFGDESISYGELNAWADGLACRLRTLGVGPDVPVGLCVDRSPAMAASVLGILKAGGAYVPMDPAYPRERLQLMLENARVPVLITSAVLRAGFELSKLSCVVLDVAECGPEVRAATDAPKRAAAKDVTSAHLAYVIHTSGSTGVPKGVAMPHRPLVNLITWQLRQSSLAPGARTLQFSSLSFDVSFQEMFSTWSAGGTLVLIDDTLRRDPFALLRFLSDQKIERLFLPFVALQQLAEAYREADTPPASLREVITAGEQLQVTPGIVRLFGRLPHCTVCNQYGPTESHVVTAFTLRGPSSDWPALPPIGRPIANTQIHVLDPDGKPVPVGAEGELFIAGECLARGYLHRPDLTKERFVPNPFSGDPDARLYKTGDRARWLPDGNIEYLGRLDQQVKIRGYRIELNEVEAALAQHPAVRECAVMACAGSAGSKRLVAYVVTQDTDANGASPDFRSFLGQRLPEYMVPSAFVHLAALPLTPSGKVNRRALPEPDAGQLAGPDPGVAGVAPRNAVEERLVAIWRETLGLEQVGVEQNFFELGGHSLLAVQMIVKVKQALGRELSVAAVFQNPTIEKLARKLEDTAEFAPSGSSLVEIQPKGTKPPLFLVHGAGGGMFWGYANLARHLGDDQPVMAFSSRGLDDGREHETIEAMAAAYVADLRAFQPRGPYRLGGYCFGGNVAYEMARQLEAMGETVALLAVFNGWPSNSSYTRPRVTPAMCVRFLQNLRFWGGYVLQLKPAQQRELILWKVRALGRRGLRLISRPRTTTPDIDVAEWVDLAAQPKERHDLWGSHIRAYLEYRAQPIRGHLTLFRTRCHPLICSFDEACGWRELAGGGVSVHVVPGAHESILDEPHVQTLARALKQELAEASQRGSEPFPSVTKEEPPLESHPRWGLGTTPRNHKASLTEHKP